MAAMGQKETKVADLCQRIEYYPANALPAYRAGRQATEGRAESHRSRTDTASARKETVNAMAYPGFPSNCYSDPEMADNQLLDPAAAAAIERVPGIEKRGNRAGNWLMKEQANDLLNAPSSGTLTGLRDRAILALLLGCGLRRAELLRIDVDDLEQREGRWVLPDMAGKGSRIRTVTVPAGVKARIDAWVKAAGIAEGRLFRPVSKAGVLAGEEIRDEKAVWRLVVRYAKAAGLGKLAPHDLRRTCAKLCRKAGGELEQIQLLLGHASIQTTERYLGTEQALAHAVNDAIGLDMA
jgi:integrase/recombinase XerD